MAPTEVSSGPIRPAVVRSARLSAPFLLGEAAGLKPPRHVVLEDIDQRHRSMVVDYVVVYRWFGVVIADDASKHLECFYILNIFLGIKLEVYIWVNI